MIYQRSLGEAYREEHLRCDGLIDLDEIVNVYLILVYLLKDILQE